MAGKISRVLIVFAVGAIAVFGLSSVTVAQSPVRATVSGHIRDSAGKPQMGVRVEVFTAAASKPITAYTDPKGFYSAAGLLPGVYLVKATASSFLPSLREGVDLRSGANVMVNLTLNTLVEAFQMIPSRRSKDKANDDDWGWTLRSAANRPILRALEKDGPLVVVSGSEDPEDRALKARVAFIAGSGGSGYSGSETAFNVEQSLFGSGPTAGVLGFNGDLGYCDGQANGVVRASYKRQSFYGSHPEVTITARHYASALAAANHAALNAIALSVSDGFNIDNLLEFNYGGELQSVQFRGRVNAFRPYGTVGLHLRPDTLLEYRYVTSEPTTRAEKGFDTSPVDLSEANPRVSLQNSVPQVERSRHQEIALSQRIGKNSFQAAYYSDVIHRMALTGVGSSESISDFESSSILPDVYSSTFAFTGGDLSTDGFRLVAQRAISDSLTATLDYSYGGALNVDTPDSTLAGTVLSHANRHAIAGKMAGNIPGWKTKWIASYKWTSGSDVVSLVDAFNASAGQADPFLNIFLRQPIPGTSFLPGKVEALVDVRNLLSQGYVPLIGQDGRTLYLVQSARTVRGGVAFNF